MVVGIPSIYRSCRGGKSCFRKNFVTFSKEWRLEFKYPYLTNNFNLRLRQQAGTKQFLIIIMRVL